MGGKKGVVYGAGEDVTLCAEQQSVNDDSDGVCYSKVIHSPVQV